MREIKFRGKWLKNGKWVCGGYFWENGDGTTWHYIVTENMDNIEVVPETVGQFTGLHDKDGEGIYEGDSLGGIFGDAFIAYCDRCKQFQLFSSEDGCLCCLGEVQWREVVESDEDLEVIGNVHEQREATTNASQMVHLP